VLHPSKTWPSDAELVARILAGSREDFELLYETYFPRVFRFAVRRLHDAGEAEDVTQEVFLAVFNSLSSFHGNSSLLVWIFGITRNTVNRRFRRSRLRTESIDSEQAGELAGNAVPPDQAVDARRILASCEAVIEKQLTPLQRRIFTSSTCAGGRSARSRAHSTSPRTRSRPTSTGCAARSPSPLRTSRR
jgi:RNA polymerase sigma-70 factor (ECF subfamily)